MSARVDRLAKLEATYRRMADTTVRSSDAGWRFYDVTGPGIPLKPGEGEALHREAMGRVDRLIASLDGGSWFMVLIAGASGFVLLKVLSELQLFGMSPSWIFLLIGIYWLFRDVIIELRFAHETQAWRKATAARLRAGREPAGAAYSLLDDERLGVWIGWALLGPGILGFMLFYEDFAGFFICLAMSVAGALVLRAAHGVTAD